VAKNVGLDAGRLRACPKDKNCVTSQDRSDIAHFLEPIRHDGDVPRAKQALREILGELPRTSFVTEGETYWHVEFRSVLFGFVDDVELLFDPTEPVIHIRSASRVGTYDWGVNRRRVERIRQMFEERSSERPFAERPGVERAA
jgi:uncharacterized protein (DUF1499 family)